VRACDVNEHRLCHRACVGRERPMACTSGVTPRGPPPRAGNVLRARSETLGRNGARRAAAVDLGTPLPHNRANLVPADRTIMTTRRIALVTALFTMTLAAPALAEDLVVATFGGTFVDNSKKCHAAAFEKATGATVKFVLGSSVQTAAKLRAAGGRSEIDVAYM